MLSAAPPLDARVQYGRVLRRRRRSTSGAALDGGLPAGAARLRSRRLPRLALSVSALLTVLSALPTLAYVRLAQSRGLSISPLHALVGAPRIDVTPTTVTFARGNDWQLLGDLYRPPVGRPRAAIVLAHGGAWTSGDKGEGSDWSRWLAARGYLVFDVQYRLAADAAWQDSAADLNAAAHWLRLHAADLEVDPGRLVLMGRSAGAHLALLAAYHSEIPPAAVVALYPPTDLELLYARAPDLLAQVPPRTDLVDASPLRYARQEVPPTLLIHGTWDDTVSVEHTRRLRVPSRKTERRSRFCTWHSARHAFDLLPESLAAQVARAWIDVFLRGLAL